MYIQATHLEPTLVHVASADLPGQVTRQKRLIRSVAAPPSGMCPAQPDDSRLSTGSAGHMKKGVSAQ